MAMELMIAKVRIDGDKTMVVVISGTISIWRSADCSTRGALG
jgi:hypothetical protein